MLSRVVLKRRLTFFLLFIAGLMGGYLVFSYCAMMIEESYVSKIGLASRQKGLAEELTRRMLQIANGQYNKSELAHHLDELKGGVKRWEEAQKALLNGSEQYGTSFTNSTSVQIMLQSTNNSLVRCTDILKQFLNNGGSVSNDKLDKYLEEIRVYEHGISNAVSTYVIEHTELNKWARVALGTFVGLLLLTLLYAYKRIKQPMEALYDEASQLLANKKELSDSSEGTKAEFLANMSHEVRTPLNGVLGMTDLLSRTQLNEEQRGYVRSIHSSARNLLDLMNDVLDYSKIKSGKLELYKERFNLLECMEQVVDLMKPLASVKQLELMTDVDPEVPIELVQDERRLRQVLLGLVSNAIKFTDNGEVTVRVEIVNRESDFVQIKFSVTDTGIGMSQETISNLFQAFYQADSSISKRYGGSGLGLAIAKNLVQEMGGRIWVDSTLGKGSTFSFTIVAETAGTENKIKLKALQGLKALVVDDNKTNLKILVKQLSSWGMQATPFNSPELVAEIMSNLHKFHFIIMDMQMPEMDGSALARKIRTKYSLEQLPIIVLSSVDEHLMTDTDGLYNAYLTKPVKITRLLDTICDVMKLSPAFKAKESLQRGNAEIPMPKSNLRILVAQDNELSKAVTAKTLELLGHKFESVSSAGEVVEKTMANDFDLIIMDVEMEGSDSMEAARRIKKMTAHNHIVPVIFGLSNNAAGDKQRCSQAGMDDVVPKPMRADVLQEKINQWLEVE